MEKLILVKYGEIHLKGLNRPYFIRSLKERLIQRTKPFGGYVWEQGGRLYIMNYAEEDEQSVIEAAANTFGVVAVCPAASVDKDDEQIFATALSLIKEAAQGVDNPTFKINARRQDKSFHYNSQEICIEAGGYILQRMPELKVDVHTPKLSVEIEIRDKAYLYCKEYKGVGGLPVGVSGKAALMLSGGIDSPVAGYMMAKRGLTIEAVHFLSPPYTGEAAKQKVFDLTKRLTSYCGPIKLHLINFTEIQERIYNDCHDSYLTIIMRRFMCRIAEAIAKKDNAGALITGESLGQVASQTIAAINATNSSVDLPIFRPLIGMDKQEIIDIASSIDTFDISIREGEDCCTVFVPKHPALHAELERVIEEEEKLPWRELTDRAVRSKETVVIR